MKLKRHLLLRRFARLSRRVVVHQSVTRRLFVLGNLQHGKPHRQVHLRGTLHEATRDGNYRTKRQRPNLHKRSRNSVERPLSECTRRERR